jgi:ribosome-associated heat shock protein Hsp15
VASINGVPTNKANQTVRIGDVIAVPQGAYVRTVRVTALGSRRGPAPEARLLYEECAVPVRLSGLEATWMPLLADDEENTPNPLAR